MSGVARIVSPIPAIEMTRIFIEAISQPWKLFLFALFFLVYHFGLHLSLPLSQRGSAGFKRFKPALPPYRSRNLVADLVFVTLKFMAVEVDPDAALMLRVKQGDTTAFAQLVEKYKQPIINFAYRLIRDETEAEDLAQSAFVQVFKSAARYEVTSKFTTWLFTITRNLCLNEIRRRTRHPAHSIDAPYQEGDEAMETQLPDSKNFGPPDTLLQHELENKIEEALAQLPENQRTAIVLCRQDDVSYDEIAKVLDCSVSAVKSLIFRGRETLKSRLKAYLSTGTWHAPK